MTTENETRAELPSFERRQIADEEVRALFARIDSEGQSGKPIRELWKNLGAIIEAALRADDDMSNLNVILRQTIEADK